jgi:hypothetical protein
VHYSLERFEELLVLIAERLRRRHLDPETVVEFRNPNRRLNLLIAVGAAIGFLVAGGSLWSFGCATSAVIVLATASLAASTAACWGFLGVVRTLIDTTGVTRERRCWTTKVPFAEMDDVLIGLTPGQVKLLNVEVRLRSGRRRSLMSPGIDPIALFNTVLEGLRRANP